MHIILQLTESQEIVTAVNKPQSVSGNREWGKRISFSLVGNGLSEAVTWLK